VTTTTARDDATGIVVEVGPGGTLHSFSLADRAMRLDGPRLAAAIVRLVDTAAARADRRAAIELGADLTPLGLDTTPAEAAERTTPDTWMR
jgi:hypothetical protein